MTHRSHFELHSNDRISWLRAAVLGANDGIISTVCLLLGVAAASAGRSELLTAGAAALVAGAMSMAAGEYVSVSSQGDAEKADLDREREELRTQPAAEQHELASIYVARGLTPELAAQVAHQLMAHDALNAHARDELGIHDMTRARPIQAAITSALTFSGGAAMPLIVAALIPPASLIPVLAGTSLLFLVILGWLGARAGNAPPLRAALRVGGFGILAMAVTTGIGHLLGTVI